MVGLRRVAFLPAVGLRRAAFLPAAGLRRVAFLPAVALLVAACSGGPADVVGVTVAVPSGWERVETPENPEVVASATWRGGQGEASSLQVVVGCGPGSVTDLASAAVTQERPPLTAVDAEVDTETEVAGADAAIGLELTLGADGAADGSTVVVNGLYAEAAGALVLVELSTPSGDADDPLVSATLESVTLDPDALSEACGDG